MNKYTITYYSEKIQSEILELPDTLLARYLKLTSVMIDEGTNLGMPHTKAMGNGLFELRLKGLEGIARVFYCTIINKQIVMLHSFVKKTDKTPDKELNIAIKRMKEVQSK